MRLITRRLARLPTSIITSLDISILAPPFYSDGSIRTPVSLHEEHGLPTVSSKKVRGVKVAL